MPKESRSVTQTLSSLTPLAPPGSTSPPRRAALRIHFPDAVVSQPGTHLSKQESAVAPSFSVSALALDNLLFPNCDLSPTTSAASHSSSGSRRLSQEPGSAVLLPRYLVAGLDLDPPFPSFPVMGPILHSMQADLTLAADELDPESDEFIPLQPAPEDGAGASRPVAAYMGPAPPGLSSPHRYMFMMWEQPAGVTGERIREELGFGEDGAGLMTRMRWDQEAFERKLGLGRVVAGNYFVC
ncbi:phosphatidylethanolamine-binding protein [Podospora conica]|nr:phosphatidylethanolamine-binding protein [Schizothecium conicum]